MACKIELMAGCVTVYLHEFSLPNLSATYSFKEFDKTDGGGLGIPIQTTEPKS